MRSMIVALNSNACGKNTPGTGNRIGFLVLCVLAAAASCALAGPSDDKTWMACQEHADCTSVAVSCDDVWQPVNKKYVAEMKKAKTLPNCLGTIAKLDPPPASDCVKGICVHVHSSVKASDPSRKARARRGLP